jgi:hypothetical protein
MNTEMKYDKAYYEKMGQEFLRELNDEEFTIEILENDGPPREKKEYADLVAFQEHLESDDFKFFNEEVPKK